MTVAEMRNFERENGLRGYMRHMRRTDLINFFRNSHQPAPASRPPPPLVRCTPDRPRRPQLLRQPSSQEMDILERQKCVKVDHK